MREVLTNSQIETALTSNLNFQFLLYLWLILIVVVFIIGMIFSVKKYYKNEKKANMYHPVIMKISKILILPLCLVLFGSICWIGFSNWQFRENLRNAINNHTWYINIQSPTSKDATDWSDGLGTEYYIMFGDYIYETEFEEWNNVKYNDKYYLIMIPNSKGVYPELFYSLNKYIYEDNSGLPQNVD